MTKSSGKFNSKKGYYIKDKAIIRFIVQHSKKQKIDFSKFRIPSFLQENEEEEKCIYKEPIFDSKKFYINKKEKKMLENHISFPSFKFSFLKDSISGFINNNNESKINSSLFN